MLWLELNEAVLGLDIQDERGGTLYRIEIVRTQGPEFSYEASMAQSPDPKTVDGGSLLDAVSCLGLNGEKERIAFPTGIPRCNRHCNREPQVLVVSGIEDNDRP